MGTKKKECVRAEWKDYVTRRELVRTLKRLKVTTWKTVEWSDDVAIWIWMEKKKHV